RRIRKRLTKLRDDLADVERTRALKRKSRIRSRVPQISLVGYTNSGKSTLLNAMTGAGVLVEDRLFSTLDPTARRLDLPDGPEAVLISAVRGDGLEELLAMLGERVAAARLVAAFEIPFDRGDLRSQLHEEGDVLEETFEPGGYRLQVRTSQDVLARFSGFLVN